MGKAGTRRGQLIFRCVITLNNNKKEISSISPLSSRHWGSSLPLLEGFYP